MMKYTNLINAENIMNHLHFQCATATLVPLLFIFI